MAGLFPHANPAMAQADATGGAPLAESAAPAPVYEPAMTRPFQPAPVGTEIRIDSLRGAADSVLNRTPVTTPGWIVTPELGIQEMYNDNLFQTSSNRKNDFISNITPGITVSGNTPHVELNFTYAPTIQLYAYNSSENAFLQNYNGQTHITLLPGLMFVDARAYGAQQVTQGGVAPSGLPAIANANRLQTSGFSVTPYLQHRFGSIGTAVLGYSLSYLNQSGEGQSLPFGAGQTFADASLLTQEGQASFRTGEDLGRFNNYVLLDAIGSTGHGAIVSGTRKLALDTLSYAVNRNFTVLGSIGYEAIHYDGTPVVNIDDMVWAVGFRLNPGPDRTLTVTYGHHDGVDSAYVDLAWALTAQTKAFLRYSEDLTTSAQMISNYVNSSTVDQYGNSVDPVTGAPVLLANSFFATNNNLSLVKSFSATLVTTPGRNTISLVLLHQNQKVIATSPGLTSFGQQGTTATLNWLRELTPVLSSRVSVQYGTLQFTTVNTEKQQTFTLDSALNYRFNETLTGSLEYIFTNRTSTLGQLGYYQNIFLVGLHKTF